MEYTIQSTERTKAKGSEFETKALLYLLSFREDSEEIYYFVVDFFNDLTGVDRYSSKMWDLQSKGAKKNYQGDIGKELVTLYKNFLSPLEIETYILFLGGVVDSVKIDKNKNIFGIENITTKAKKAIKKALVNESKSKEYIKESEINDEELDVFLSKVLFVIDDKRKSDYIREMIKVNPKIIESDIQLERIFDQIRDVQSGKKNNNNVEGKVIYSQDEFVYYNRHIKADEIKLMVLSRLVNTNIMEKGIPTPFIPIYIKFPAGEKEDIIDDCKMKIAKTLFDKNNEQHAWKLFDCMYSILKSNSEKSIDESYKLLDKDILNNVSALDMISAKYLMALIKDGIDED